jgi:hypothetical protein
LLVLARLPLRLRASRRASTRSRLGLLTRRPPLWREAAELLNPEAAGADATGRVGVAGGGVTGAAGRAGGASVRVGRASSAVRTRLAPEVKRPAAFLPPVVRALRRSSAASRLDVLAMSARRMESCW